MTNRTPLRGEVLDKVEKMRQQLEGFWGGRMTLEVREINQESPISDYDYLLVASASLMYPDKNHVVCIPIHHDIWSRDVDRTLYQLKAKLEIGVIKHALGIEVEE